MPARKKSGARLTGAFFMLLNTLCWGAALPISKFAVESTDSFLFLLYRFGLASLLSLPFLIPLWKRVKPNWKNIAEIIGLELLGTSVALGLLYWGLSLTTSLEASLLTMTIPVFVTIGGILYLKEKEEKREWIGLFIALFGTLFLTFEPLLSGKTNGQLFTSLEGNTLILLSNIVAAAYYLLAKRRYTKYPKLFVTGISFWVGAISFLIASVFLTGDSFFSIVARDFSTSAVLWPSLYMAIFGSILGLTAYIKGQSLMEASEASLFTYLHPIVALPIAFVLHRELPSWLMLVALLVIAIGVGIAELPRFRKPTQRTLRKIAQKRAPSLR